MALCVLTAGWKTAGLNAENGGLIDGLLAIIVDHGLREESKHEANVVSHRVSEMGTSISGMLYVYFSSVGQFLKHFLQYYC